MIRYLWRRLWRRCVECGKRRWAPHYYSASYPLHCKYCARKIETAKPWMYDN